MAVVMSMRWKGVTQDQYEQSRKLVNFEGNPPAGGLYHAAFFDDDGLRVVDVWETPEQLQAFVGQRLMPGVAPLGIPTQPEVEVLPAYNLFTPGYTAKR